MLKARSSGADLMGEYTELGNNTIEKTVDDIISNVTAQLVSHFRPRSIILAGSFGRGEASIGNYRGKLEFLSDCEVVLVANRYLSTQRINKKLSTVIAQENMPKFVIRSSIALPVYSLIPLRSFLWKPNVWNYDLKYGSRTVYGQNYLEKMPGFKPDQIPAWEGIRLIFNRIAEALKYFPTGDTLSTPEQERETTFWITKIILACQDALLIAEGSYHVSCRMRNELFQKSFGQNFAGLQRELSRFPSLTAKATNHKLKQESFGTDTRELWFDTAKICDAVLRYLLRQKMNINFDNYLELQEKFMGRAVLRYLMTLARKFSTRSFVLALPPVIRAGGSWLQLIYPAVALLYFSFTRDGVIDKPLLDRARNTASLFVQMKPIHSDPIEEWKYLRDEIYHLWYALGK